MRSWGISLIIIGALGLIYPLMGRRLLILSFLDGEATNIVSILIIGAGVVLFVVSLLQQKKSASGTKTGPGDGAAGTGGAHT